MPLLKTALSGALIEFNLSGLRDCVPNGTDIVASNALSESRDNDIVAQSKSLGRNSARAGVPRCATCDSGRRFALQICLSVKRAHREDRHHVGAKLSTDHPLGSISVEHARLRDHLSDNIAGDNNEEFGGPRMEMNGSHGTGFSVSLVLADKRGQFLYLRPNVAAIMAPPVPTRAGKALSLAKAPLFLLKSKMKSSSLGRSVYRSAALNLSIRYLNGN